MSWGSRVLAAGGPAGPPPARCRLGRHLRAAGVRVIEVGRPNRQRRARQGRTDSVDAARAAAIVLAGKDLGDPETADGITEMLHVLRIARVSAVRARAKAFAALKDLIVTAPAELANSSLHGTNVISSPRALRSVLSRTSVPRGASQNSEREVVVGASRMVSA